MAERPVAGLHAGVTSGNDVDAEHGANLIVLHQQAIGVGNQDAFATVAITGRHLHDGRTSAASSVIGLLQQGDLGGFRDRLGVDLDGIDGPHCAAVEGHDVGSPSALASGSSRCLGSRNQAGLGQVGGMGVTSCFTGNDPDARANVTTGGDLLNLAVIEIGR